MTDDEFEAACDAFALGSTQSDPVTADPVVHTNGETAAVLHRVRMEATVVGQDRSGIFVISDVWLQAGSCPVAD